MTWVLEQRQALSHFLLVDDEGEEDRLPAELGLLLKVGAASTGGRAHTPIAPCDTPTLHAEESGCHRGGSCAPVEKSPQPPV